MDTSTNPKNTREVACTGTNCSIKSECKRYNLKAFGSPADYYWLSAEYIDNFKDCCNFARKRRTTKQTGDDKSTSL